MKKGFTLIELLAVIIILAIIALIAVPTIMDIINKSKTKATKISEMNYIRGINNCIMSEKLESDFQKDVQELNTSLCKNYVKGKLPTGGNVTVKSGEVIDYILEFDGKLFGPNGEFKSYSVGELVYYNPVSNELNCSDYTESNSLNENKAGCMKWYVINDNGNTLDLILDHNTTYDIAYSTFQCQQTLAANQLMSDVSGWNSQVKDTARMITADEIWRITKSTNGIPNWSSSTATEKDSFYFNGNNEYGKGYAWLIDYTRICIGYGCNVEDSNAGGYWTSNTVGKNNQSTYSISDSEIKVQQMGLKATPMEIGCEDYVWYVSSIGKLDVISDSKYSYGMSGLRPVITITK